MEKISEIAIRPLRIAFDHWQLRDTYEEVDEFHKILWMPEALIIQRYKYDKQKRDEYYGDKKTPYDNVDEETGRVTATWWERFNSLDKMQRKQIETIITDHKFTDEDIDVSDTQIKEVLKFYQIKRDEK